MARKRTRRAPTPAAAERPAVTADRFARLSRLLRLLAGSALTRQALSRRLSIDVRGFYRDLEAIRAVGVGITLSKGRYRLDDSLDAALACLPFPDPHLTLAEARVLARGKSAAHRKLRQQLAQVLPEE